MKTLIFNTWKFFKRIKLKKDRRLINKRLNNLFLIIESGTIKQEDIVKEYYEIRLSLLVNKILTDSLDCV
jgi:transcription termination factor Rho